jgi:hypothetical protein
MIKANHAEKQITKGYISWDRKRDTLMTSDDRYKVLSDFRDDIDKYTSSGLSESDTRAKFVDLVLRDVLGWDEEAIRRERTFWSDSNRAAIDYEVGVPKPIFLVEAKRLLSKFELPDETGRSLYKLNGTISSCPVVWQAITQARAYCDEQGIPFALVTNGSDYIFFRAICLGRPWREGFAFVTSLDSLLQKHFKHFHSALCAETGNVSGMDSLLRASPLVISGIRIADSFAAQAGRLSNRLSDLLTNTFGAVLRDQPEPTREFLEQCYSSDPSVNFYAKSLRGLLKDPTPMFSTEVAVIKPGHRKDPFGKALSALMDSQGIRPPVVVIGGKGFGKTTFLQWFLKASSFHKEIQKQIVLWVDFRPAGYAASSVDDEVRRNLIRQLENSSALSLNTFGGLQQVFHDRISIEKNRFLAPYADDPKEIDKKIVELIQQWQQDTQGYLLALIRYAVSHCNKQVFIVLDNSDHKSSEFQFAVYNVAQQLATALPVNIVVALRESTFYRLCRMPQGDAFSQQQVFHIRAPNIQSVLNHRFSFLANQLKKKKSILRSASGIEISIENIGQFLTLLKRSMLDGQDSPLILEMLAAMSNGSVREALNLVNEFLVSGHTKMEDYVWTYALKSTSTIPFHEFIASVMLDEMAFFREDYSHTFINLFARSSAPGDSHFTRSRLLHLIRVLSPGNQFRPDDYVRLNTLKARAMAIGVPDASLDAHIQTLVRFGLLQPDTLTTLDDPGAKDTEYENISAIHITAAGHYYIDRLAGTFQYLQRVAPDVPIVDKNTAIKMSELFGPFKDKPYMVPVNIGVQVVKILVDYLATQEELEHSEGLVSRDPILSTVRFVEPIIASIAPDLKSIEKWAMKTQSNPNK